MTIELVSRIVQDVRFLHPAFKRLIGDGNLPGAKASKGAKEPMLRKYGVEMFSRQYAWM